MRLKFLSLIAVVMLAVTLYTCSRANGQVKNIPAKAVDFTLETLDGNSIVLSEVLKEKKVILIFWASWCVYCKQELVEVEKFYTENKDKVEVIAVNLQDSNAKAAKAIEGKNISYPVALDRKGDVAGLYNVVGLPTIVTIDRDSRILYYGHSSAEMLKKTEF
ncbi:MAG: TlpA disulfide reductase family protein [Candidatus Omnitrophota bacterium]